MTSSLPAAARTAAFVFHPLKTDVGELRRVAERYETELGWGPSLWLPTEVETPGSELARRAVAAGAEVVVAVGGDGTVRSVAEELRHHEAALAIVPQGTGNLLARNLGIPLNDVEAGVAAAFQEQARPVDLGVVELRRPDGETEEHGFLVLAGMGLDARAITATNSALKKRIGWLAYVDAGIRTMVKDSPLRVRYSIDGSPKKALTVFTVMIGNCGLLPGGLLLIPDAELDDGKLDVVALRPIGPFSWLRIWNKIGWENGVLRKSKTGRKIIDLVNDTKHVTYVKGTEYALSVERPEPVQLDGDDFGLVLGVRGTVARHALSVRVLPGWVAAVPLG